MPDRIEWDYSAVGDQELLRKNGLFVQARVEFERNGVSDVKSGCLLVDTGAERTALANSLLFDEKEDFPSLHAACYIQFGQTKLIERDESIDNFSFQRFGFKLSSLILINYPPGGAPSQDFSFASFPVWNYEKINHHKNISEYWKHRTKPFSALGVLGRDFLNGKKFVYEIPKLFLEW